MCIMTHFATEQRLAQYYKSTILQSIIKFLKREREKQSLFLADGLRTLSSNKDPRFFSSSASHKEKDIKRAYLKCENINCKLVSYQCFDPFKCKEIQVSTQTCNFQGKKKRITQRHSSSLKNATCWTLFDQQLKSKPLIPTRKRVLLLDLFSIIIINIIISKMHRLKYQIYYKICLLCCAQIVSNPMDCSPAGPSVHGIFQAGILE